MVNVSESNNYLLEPEVVLVRPFLMVQQQFEIKMSTPTPANNTISYPH